MYLLDAISQTRDKKSYPHITHFYMALSFQFSNNVRPNFTHSVFDNNDIMVCSV